MTKQKEHHHLSPKDVFLQLLLIITLYFSAGSFITLLFQYVNIAIPDPLTEHYFSVEASYFGPLRFAIASLIVVFPAFMIVSWYLNRMEHKEPAKRELRLRKWLMYFTLFAAAIIIGGDLVSLVHSYLGGELTSRFALKALSVLVVAGTVFAYYLWDIRQEKAPQHLRMIAIPVIVVVAVGVVAGFFFAGSPQQQRLIRFDNQRISDLQIVQSQIVSYWQRKEKLPATLLDLEDDISGFQAPRDPETQQAYEYIVSRAETFLLCATFAQASEGANAGGRMPYKAMPPAEQFVGSGGVLGSTSWAHTVGRHCFERTIDKDLYPPENQKQ